MPGDPTPPPVYRRASRSPRLRLTSWRRLRAPGYRSGTSRRRCGPARSWAGGARG